MHSSERTLTDSHGVEVFYRTWPVEGPTGVVVIAHGLAEHSGRYDRFGHALNDAGWAAYAPDLRGHGRTSEGTGVGRTGPGGGGALLEDIRDVVQVAAAESPDVPIVLFGHSMGALLTQAYTESHGDGLSGYALSACPGPMDTVDVAAEGLAAAVEEGMGDSEMDMLSAFNQPFEPARTPFDWLSRDEAEVDAYIADKYCGSNHPMTISFMFELFRLALPAIEPDAISRVPQIPVLMVTGEDDPATGMGSWARELEKRLRDAGLDVTPHFYPDARHELLNETNRDEVTADIIQWLDGIAKT
jgi:alpha-beta hydrolase superfamily lysophospholipase